MAKSKETTTFKDLLQAQQSGALRVTPPETSEEGAAPDQPYVWKGAAPTETQIEDMKGMGYKFEILEDDPDGDMPYQVVNTFEEFQRAQNRNQKLYHEAADGTDQKEAVNINTVADFAGHQAMGRSFYYPLGRDASM